MFAKPIAPSTSSPPISPRFPIAFPYFLFVPLLFFLPLLFRCIAHSLWGLKGGHIEVAAFGEGGRGVEVGNVASFE